MNLSAHQHHGRVASVVLVLLSLLSCSMPASITPRSENYPFVRNDPRVAKVAPPSAPAGSEDLHMLNGDRPPASWSGTLEGAYPPEALSLLDAPVYVGGGVPSSV